MDFSMNKIHEKSVIIFRKLKFKIQFKSDLETLES